MTARSIDELLTGSPDGTANSPDGTANDLAGLRKELARLETQLAGNESWCALGQLKEREQRGEALDPAIATTLRDAIEGKLAANEDYQAHCRASAQLSVLTSRKPSDDVSCKLQSDEGQAAAAVAERPTAAFRTNIKIKPLSIAAAARIGAETKARALHIITDLAKETQLAGAGESVASQNGSQPPRLDVPARKPEINLATFSASQGAVPPNAYHKLRRKQRLKAVDQTEPVLGAGSDTDNHSALGSRARGGGPLAKISARLATAIAATTAVPLIFNDAFSPTPATATDADEGEDTACSKDQLPEADEVVAEPASADASKKASEVVSGLDVETGSAEVDIPSDVPAADNESQIRAAMTAEQRASHAAAKLASIATISQINPSGDKASLVPNFEMTMRQPPDLKPPPVQLASTFAPVKPPAEARNLKQLDETQAPIEKAVAEEVTAADQIVTAALQPDTEIIYAEEIPEVASQQLPPPSASPSSATDTADEASAAADVLVFPSSSSSSSSSAAASPPEAQAARSRPDASPSAPPLPQCDNYTGDFLSQPCIIDPAIIRSSDGPASAKNVTLAGAIASGITVGKANVEEVELDTEPPVSAPSLPKSRFRQHPRSSTQTSCANTEGEKAQKLPHHNASLGQEAEIDIRGSDEATPTGAPTAKASYIRGTRIAASSYDGGSAAPGKEQPAARYTSPRNLFELEADVVIKKQDHYLAPARSDESRQTPPFTTTNTAGFMPRRESQSEARAAYHMATDEASVVIIHRGTDEVTPDLPFFKQNAHWEREGTIRKFLKALTGD